MNCVKCPIKPLNKKGYRTEWTKDRIDTIVKMWEWGTYQELAEAFPDSGYESLGQRINTLRKSGMKIPRRRIVGPFAFCWLSPIDGKKYVGCRKQRIKNGKWEFTILHNGIRKRIHRFVMEQKMGRELAKKEEVHHLDGNPENNNVDNLILTTRRDHFPFDNLRANLALEFIDQSGLLQNFKEWCNEKSKRS